MDLNSPSTWRWLWIAMAVIFATGEMLTPAAFFFLPFAIGAVAASVLSFFGVAVSVTWLAFVVTSTVAFSLLWRVGRRLERMDSSQEGVGATRWVGQEARVEESIKSNGFGTVRLEREEWRAESLTGAPIAKGSTVVVTKLAGTRLVVVPVDEPAQDMTFPELDTSPDQDGHPQGAN